MSATAVRMIVPSSVMIIRSSSSRTISWQASGPVFSVRFMALTPLPPRDWARYSATGVRFP